MKENKKEILLLSSDYIDAIIHSTHKNKMANFLFMFFIKRMDAQNSCSITNLELQQELSCSRPAVEKAVNYLENLEWISVQKNGTSNVYIVNPEVAYVK